MFSVGFLLKIREKKEKIPEIRQNVHESIFELVTHVTKLGIPFEHESHKRYAEFLTNLGRIVPPTWTNVKLLELISIKML